MATKNTFQFIDVIKELEGVELAPLILPLMKIIDPIAKEIPEGLIKQALTNIRPRPGQFDFLGKVAPAMPLMVRWAGKAAAIKPLMLVFGLAAEALALVLRVAMPAIAILVRILASGITTVMQLMKRQTA
jgi:hypothetical protein